MAGYKDRTYCTFFTKCADGDKCDKALTDDIVQGAHEAKMDISQFIEKPTCFKKESDEGRHS
jgi:hypothetical protein